jgi:hypothetical protein
MKRRGRPPLFESSEPLVELKVKVPPEVKAALEDHAEAEDEPSLAALLRSILMAWLAHGGRADR